MRLVQHDIQQIMHKKTLGAIARTGANWAFMAEKPTKYFLNLEKIRYNKKTIVQLENSKGEKISNPNLILTEIRNFYNDLYTSKGSRNLEYTNKLDIPKISEEDKQMLDKPIEMFEISAALKELGNDKCGGTDGLSADFYKVFWNKLKEPYYNMIKEVINDGKFHLTARRGVLSLLEKSGKNPLKLEQWRPLTLFNVDNKIYSKVLANRLHSVSNSIIHQSQTGFLRRRQLSENLKILELIDNCIVNQVNGVLISFDFRKAFDTVEWETIFHSLRCFNIGEYYIKLVRILFQDPELYVMNNGFWSKPINPTRGLRQGCCYSPGVFNVVVEILGLAIRQNANIEGLKVGTQEIKCSQFADDLWTSSKATSSSVNAILKELVSFRDFSGLIINAEKSCILRVGPWHNSDAKFYTMRKLYWSPKAIKILGIYIHNLPEVVWYENFYKLLEKVDKILSSWIHRDLSLMGKIVVINSLINTLFIHKYLALPTPPDDFFKVYKNKVLKFIWGG